MKKIVAAFLSIVLTISTCLVPAFAIDSSILALSDVDQIDAKYLEAIEYVVSENIITGYSDGTFHPKGVLTRGAASRMLAVMSLGIDTANALLASSVPFSDVPVDNVFAGCVSYCVDSGFAGGYSDGTFRPKGALTAGAFAKMLLMYIKYQPDISRYTGSSWLSNVTADARSCGIFTDDMGFTPSGDLTREGAAYLIYNAKHWNGTPNTSVSPTTPVTSTAPTAITLSATTQTIYVGQGVGLTATITPSTAADKTVTWSSSNKAVATVDATGYVWGNAAGTTTITAKTVNGKQASITISVIKISPVGAPIGSELCSSGLGFYTNSADGVQAYWEAKNKSGKTINYYTVHFSMQNAVGDPAYDQITGKSTVTVKYVGPVAPGDSLLVYSVIGYSAVCHMITLTTIDLEYSDGTSESISYGYSGYKTLWHRR